MVYIQEEAYNKHYPHVMKMIESVKIEGPRKDESARIGESSNSSKLMYIGVFTVSGAVFRGIKRLLK